ncbi:efflux RND transporter periplasmic adaptor subunit [Chloroflexota bacterium]
MRRGKVVAVVLLCLALAGAVGCRPIRDGGGAGEFTGELVEVVRGDLIISVSGSGSVDVTSEVGLSFDKGGEVSKLYVEEGDGVIAGEVLALLAPVDREALELAVTQAEAALMQAEYNLDKAENPYTDDEIEDAEQAVEDAEDWLDLADDMLRYALQHGSDQEVLQWQMEVLNAEIQLEMAEDTLDEMLNERDEDQIEILKKQVVAAEQALEEAQSALEWENIVAPFTGVVSSVSVEEGDIIPAPGISQVKIIHLIDTSNMELVVELDEIDVPGVSRRQRVIISVDALPDALLEGRVVSISTLPKVEAGVVSYEVKVGFDVPQGSNLRVGMSTTADIVLSDRTNALLIPDRAIRYDPQSGPVVQVMVTRETEGIREIEERSVVIGLSDGFQTEIISGLWEGEMLVIEAPNESGASSGAGFPFMAPH